MRRGEEIPYVAGGTLYLTLCNDAQHYNGVDVCEPRAPSFSITSALNALFPRTFHFFHDPALYAASKRAFDASALTPYLRSRLSPRSQLRMLAVQKAQDALDTSIGLSDHETCARTNVTHTQLARYWLHLFSLQHLVELLPHARIVFPGEHCTIHAGCLPALPIVEHSKFIIRGKEPLCTTDNASVSLLLTKIFNKALPHVCMFRSLNLTLIPVLDNRQAYEFLNDLLLVFLTGGYPTATVRASLTLSAAIVSMLRAFDPRRSLTEQHMGVYLTDYTKELFTICMRKFQDVADPAERARQAHEMALSIHNMWVYQFVLLYQVALYEFIHVGGSIWMYASETVHNVDPRHRGYLALIRQYADSVRAAFVTCFEPLAEHMIAAPLTAEYVPAWRAFRARCIELNTTLKIQLPKYIVRTRTSTEKRLYKSISSHSKSIAKVPLGWREREQLSRLAAITVCDPSYCGPKFRALVAMGVPRAVCERAEQIAFDFMGGTASKHMTFKACAPFVKAIAPRDVAMIETYLLLCRRYTEMTIGPLDAELRDQQRAALLGKFGRVDTLLPVQREIYYCVPHQQCLITVLENEGRHSHVSAFSLALPAGNEALADVDGPRKAKPSLAISQFTGRAVCSHSVGSKRTSETVVVDNREASHTPLDGFIIAFERFERITFCVLCGSRHAEHHGLWTARGPTCGIHRLALPSAGGECGAVVDAVTAQAFSLRPAVSPDRCIFTTYNTNDKSTCDAVYAHMQTWDAHSMRFRRVGLCYTHEAELLAHVDFMSYKARAVVNFETIERVAQALDRARTERRFGDTNRLLRK